MTLQQTSIAPGPRELPLLGSLFEFRQDVLGLMLRSMQAYGDVARIHLGPVVVHLICHPDHIERVLKDQANYDKATLSSRVIRRLTGASLLVSNGELWQRQRRLMQPAFSPSHTARYVDTMVQATQAMIADWEASADSGQSIDVASEMMRLTYRIVEQVLFSASSADDLGAIESAITVALAHIYRQIELGGAIPAWLPTPSNLAFRRAVKVLDHRVYEIIEQHRRRQGGDDLLSMLMAVRHDESGNAMDDQQVRNETVALLIAGHETTANALTWFWYLLSQHPQVAEQLRDEVHAVLGDRTPAAEDLAALHRTTHAVLESMRLYPPIWSMIRRVVTADEIGGYRIPAGSRVVISPYVTHRHPQFWSEPERFDPSRFEPQRTKARHHYAYLPFGGGPRVCIGQNLARAEAVVIAALVLQSFRLRLVPGHAVEMQPGITLRAKQGLRVTLER